MEKVLYRGFTLIDGRGEAPAEDSYMVVEGRKILEVGSGAKEDFQGPVVELGGKYIMPGLINSHVHITMEPVGNPISLMASESVTKTTVRAIGNLGKHLRARTTFFRDLGAPYGIDLDLRDAVNEGLVEGPGFLAAGKCVTMTGGHGWFMGREADGVEETRKAAREQLKAGADLVKIMATGGVLTKGVEPGSPQLSMEEMKSAVEEAHKAGKKTATHAQGTEGIKNAILAGIDSVEHGIFLDDETINLMLEKGVYLVPTLVAPYFIVENGVEAGIPQYAVDKSNYVMKYHMDSFTRAYEAGVKIAMGTDSGTPYNPHGSAPTEIKLMVQCGMGVMDALVASTRSSAELLGIDSDYGTLEEGKYADFLVLDENPLENLDTLFEINAVYKLGKKYE